MTAFEPHVKRCRRLRPHGANGFFSPGAEACQGLWGVGDVSDLIRQLREKIGIAEDTGMDVVRGLFQQWDENGDGNISKAELTAVLQTLMPDFTPEQIEALFNTADEDHDGAIDYKEFLNLLIDPNSARQLSQKDIEALRALFNRFDKDLDGFLKPGEFKTLMQNMIPTRASDFDVADVDSNGSISFDEFVKYWSSVVGKAGFRAGQLDEVADMFLRFDRNDSGELDREEFVTLLDNIFPDHCEQNREIMDAEFAGCDSDHSEGISFHEFLAYYDRLQHWYGKSSGWPPHDEEERIETLGQDLLRSHCGLEFLPDRLHVHQRSCEECRRWMAEAEEARRKAREEAMAAAAAAEEARRRAQEESDERRRRAEEEARRLAEAAARAKAAEELDENGFKRCRFCARTFFPDRLPRHESICPKNQGATHGCRPTVTPGEALDRPTIGRYAIPAGG